MKDYVFNVKQGNERHLIRYDGETEADAFKKVQEMFPGSVKLAAFEVTPELDKLLAAVKFADQKELDEIAAYNARKAKGNAFDQMKSKIELNKRNEIANALEKKALENGDIDQSDWNVLCSSMSQEEKKTMYDEFMADADKNHQSDPAAAELEKNFINYIFGVKEKGKWDRGRLTVRDLAKMLGISHVRVLAIQKEALRKLVSNIAKAKHYPFKIESAAEAIALLMADNAANPEQLRLKAKVNGGITFEEALKKMEKMEVEQKKIRAAKIKKDEQARRKAMAEFKQLEKETNQLRDKLHLPRKYEQFFRFFKGQKAGTWSA